MGNAGQEGKSRGLGTDGLGFASLIASAALIYGLNNVNTSAMPSYILDLGGSEFLSSAQTSLFVGLAVLLRIFFGRVSDKRGPRLVMVIGALGFTIPCVLIPLASELWQVLALRLSQAVGLAAYHPCVAHSLSRITPEEEVGRRMGVVRFSSTLSLMVGPAILFPLIDSMGFGVFFGVLAAVGFAGLLLLLPIDDHQHEQGEQGEQGVLGEGVQARAEARGASEEGAAEEGSPRPFGRSQVALIVATFVCAIGYACLLNFGRSLAKVTLPDMNDGLVFTFLAAGGLIGSLLCGRLVDTRGPRVTVTGCLALMAAGAVALSLAGNVVGLFAGAALFGMGYYGATTALTASASRVTSAATRGRFIALQQSSLDLGIVAGGLVAGAIVQLTGSVTGAFIVSAAVIAAFAPVWLATSRGTSTSTNCP